MLSMSTNSMELLKQHISKALEMDNVNHALDLIDLFITAEGVDMDSAPMILEM
ncbi:MAG: hypothetical protein PHG02_05690 [Oscillospiraceae bacterium]|nr:hypothetical protein [Oscillospiraceae bacterium]